MTEITSFQDIENMIAQLERGELTAPEAVEQLQAARIALLQLCGNFRRMATRIQQDPQEIESIRARYLTGVLFQNTQPIGE